MIFHHILSELDPHFGKGPKRGFKKNFVATFFSAKGGSNQVN